MVDLRTRAHAPFSSPEAELPFKLSPLGLRCGSLTVADPSDMWWS